MSGFEIVGLVLAVMGLAVTPLPPKIMSLMKAAKAESKARRFLDRSNNRLMIFRDLFLNECKRLLRPFDLQDEDIEQLFGEGGAQDSRWKSEVFVQELEKYLRSSAAPISKAMKEIHSDFEEVQGRLGKLNIMSNETDENDMDTTEDSKLSLRKKNKILSQREKIKDSLDSLKESLELLRQLITKFLDSRGEIPTTTLVSKTSLKKRSKWEQIGAHFSDSQRMSERLSDYILRCHCPCHHLNLRLDFHCLADENQKIAFRFLVQFRGDDLSQAAEAMTDLMNVDFSSGITLKELEVEVRKIARARRIKYAQMAAAASHEQPKLPVSGPHLPTTSQLMPPPPPPPPNDPSKKRMRASFVSAVANITESVSNKLRKVTPVPPPAPDKPHVPAQFEQVDEQSEPPAYDDEPETSSLLSPVVESLCATLSSCYNPSIPATFNRAKATHENCFRIVEDASRKTDDEVKYFFYDQGGRQYPKRDFNKSTLYDILSQKSEFYARDRLKLAYELASSLLVLHLRSWMSTNWRSRDVLLLENSSSSSTPGDPPEWLPYAKNDVKTIRGIDLRTRSTHNFERSYIYSLGVILLEIGRRCPIEASFENDDEERIQVRELMSQSAVQRDLGRSFKNVVEACLSWHKKAELGDAPNDLTRETVQKAFYEEVVEQLRSLFDKQCRF